MEPIETNNDLLPESRDAVSLGSSVSQPSGDTREPLHATQQVKLARIHELHSQFMLTRAQFGVPDFATAEDRVHDALLRVAARIDDVPEPGTPAMVTFLGIVLDNLAIDAVRRDRRRRTVVDTAALAAQGVPSLDPVLRNIAAGQLEDAQRVAEFIAEHFGPRFANSKTRADGARRAPTKLWAFTVYVLSGVGVRGADAEVAGREVLLRLQDLQVETRGMASHNIPLWIENEFQPAYLELVAVWRSRFGRELPRFGA